jgi:hypothetical protein
MKKLLIIIAVLFATQAQAATFVKTEDYKHGLGWVYFYDLDIHGTPDHLSLLIFKCTEKRQADCAVGHHRQLADRKAAEIEKKMNEAAK